MHFTKDEFKALSSYSIQAIYEKFRCQKPLVNWDKSVWNILSIPKHKFISWLAVQERLQTTTILAKLGVSVNDKCLICDEREETHYHLFFQCQFSSNVLKEIKRWLGILASGNSLPRMIRWIQNSHQSKFRKQVMSAGITATLYQAWLERNQCYWQ